MTDSSRRSLAHVAVVVRDYDEAIAFYTRALGFDLIDDVALGNGKRWVLVGPRGGGVSLLLARAASAEQESRIGNQTGGRVFLFLHTDDFQRDYANYLANGVKFVEAQPRHEVYGTVIVFEDLYGNR
ncbi:MAG TPA: VOC family protein, partial [Rudaea sp.]